MRSKRAEWKKECRRRRRARGKPPKKTEKELFADQLRTNATWHEIKMRQLLRELEWRFCFQFVIQGYIADFIFVDRKLVVEVDGFSHVGREAYDKRRDLVLRKAGYRTVRIPNERVVSDPTGILEQVKAAFWKAEKCFDLKPFQFSKFG